MAPTELTALAAALDDVDFASPTACAGWTAHDIVAHLAAGAAETADLIEERMAGRPARPTRSFEEREPAFQALREDDLRAALVTHSRRQLAALQALAERGEAESVEFTGAAMTAARFVTHARSEAAIHRWDVAGEDPVSDDLLAQPDLTRHAVAVLDAMPVLAESSRLRAGRQPVTIVLRCPDQPDVVVTAGAGRSRFDLVEDRPAEGDVVVTTDPANRLLTIWGRRSSQRPTTVAAGTTTPEVVRSVLWPAAQTWPR